MSKDKNSPKVVAGCSGRAKKQLCVKIEKKMLAIVDKGGRSRLGPPNADKGARGVGGQKLEVGVWRAS